MMMHFVFGHLLLRRLYDDTELREQLFGVPNAWLGTPASLSMLRVRYFWPLTTLPDEASELLQPARFLLFATRICGFVFLISIVLFFLSVAQAVA